MQLQLKTKRPRIEIVPMIDIMFFIVVFFMLFATFKTAQTGVKVELPKALHLGQTEYNTVIVSIDKDAGIFFGQVQVKANELGAKVKAEMQKDPGTVIVVKPDAEVVYRDLIRVMDLLAAAGVEKPMLGIERETAREDGDQI